MFGFDNDFVFGHTGVQTYWYCWSLRPIVELTQICFSVVGVGPLNLILPHEFNIAQVIMKILVPKLSPSNVVFFSITTPKHTIDIMFFFVYVGYNDFSYKSLFIQVSITGLIKIW